MNISNINEAHNFSGHSFLVLTEIKISSVVENGI